MSTQKPTILIVEDEQEIRHFIKIALQSEGYGFYESATLTDGLTQAAAQKPNLIILDLGLPDGDGIDFIRHCRHFSDSPIIILSARTDEHDKVAALDAGADDYLIKPFSVSELLARIRALLRRQLKASDDDQSIITFGKVRVDLAKRLITRNDEVIHLTQTEYQLLTVLLTNAGKVLTHRHLLREVWGPSFVESNHYLRIYIGHLRQKLEENPTQPRYITTETGIGYRFQY